MNNLTISGKSMNFYELSTNSKVARHNGFIFIQLNTLTMIFFRIYD